jgi:hypothetical protein
MYRRLLFSLMILVLVAGSASSFPRNVLYEHQTAFWMEECPPALEILYDFLSEEPYSDNAIGIVYHSTPDIVPLPEDDPWVAASLDNLHRIDYYSTGLYPDLHIDGVSLIGFPDAISLRNFHEQAEFQTSPLRINLEAYLENEIIVVNAMVEIDDASVCVGDLKIRFSLISKYWDQYTAENGASEFYYDLIGMAPNATGLDFQIESGQTQSYSVTFDWPVELDGTPVDVDNLKVVAFVQDDAPT